MTELEDAQELARVRQSVLRLYYSIDALMVIGIVVLTIYSIRLGPLVGPGVETSFGYAVSLMFLMGAVLVHVTDRAYRLWPFGRKAIVYPPGVVTDSDVAMFVKVLVVVVAAAAISFVLGSLIAA